eukprot:Platyproteum_vivax@DN15308_c0_g1_i1.p1
MYYETNVKKFGARNWNSRLITTGVDAYTFEYIDTEDPKHSASYADKIKEGRVQHEGPVATNQLQVDEIPTFRNSLNGVGEVELKPPKRKREIVFDDIRGEYVMRLLDEFEDPPPDYEEEE